MIYFFTPYSLTKDYFHAIDAHMRLLKKEDWACITDGDVLFLNQDFGHILDGYIRKYPDTGLFTCYAGRCHYKCQRLTDQLFHETNILRHKKTAVETAKKNHLQTTVLNRRIAGHLMLIRKSTWVRIRSKVEKKVIDQKKKILGIDTKICNEIIKTGLPIRLIKELYVFHFMRFDRDVNDKSHLL